jgi:hypothetical protein
VAAALAESPIGDLAVFPLLAQRPGQTGKFAEFPANPETAPIGAVSEAAARKAANWGA